MKEEIWRDAVGYEGYYQVSNLGRVRSLDKYVEWKGTIVFRKGIVLKQQTDKDGYKRLPLSKYGKMKSYMVHRLVASAFIPNPNNLPQVNHKDEDKTNNCAENLEWVTPKYNTNYGTCIQRRAEKFSKPILQFTKDGEFVGEYKSIINAAQETGINKNSISHCCIGKYKTAGGFIWKFKC